MTSRITAIVPAGGRLSRADAELCGESVKALLKIDGETLLGRLLKVLRSVDAVREIVVAGSAETRLIAERYEAGWVPETASLLGNVQAAVRDADLPGSGRILLIGSDLAAPSSDSIAEFLDRVPGDAQVAAPIVRREEYLAAYPDSPNTFLPLREGDYTLGSQFVAPAGLLLEPPCAVAAMLGRRKSQIGMALTFGFPFAVQFVTRRLTVPILERRASELLGVASGAVPGSAPNLAFDIDSFADYRYAQSLKKV